MSSKFVPVRDKTGAIVDMREATRDDETQFAQILRTYQQALVDTPVMTETQDIASVLEQDQQQQQPRASASVGRVEVAGVVAGILLALILIAALQVFWPATRATLVDPPATALSTSAGVKSAATSPATSTPVATATSPATSTPEPEPTSTPEPVVIIREPPCDAQVNPRYSVHVELPPYGSVTGVSCSSLDEAQANADSLAADLLAQFATPAR